jgi:hypothetical protein
MDIKSFEHEFRILYKNIFHKMTSDNINKFIEFIVCNEYAIKNHKHSENIITSIYKTKNIANNVIITYNDVFNDYFVIL